MAKPHDQHLRYWQNVGRTQAGNEFSYIRAETGPHETLKAPIY